MVIDTSALIAILLGEADRDLYIEAIERGDAFGLEEADDFAGGLGYQGIHDSSRFMSPASTTLQRCCGRATAELTRYIQ